MSEAVTTNQRRNAVQQSGGWAVGLMLSPVIWQCMRPTFHPTGFMFDEWRAVSIDFASGLARVGSTELLSGFQ